MDPVLSTGHLMRALVKGHGLSEGLNDGRCFRANHMGAEQVPVSGAASTLRKCTVSSGPICRDVSVLLHYRHIANAPAGSLLFGESDGGDLRVREHGGRDEPVSSRDQVRWMDQVVLDHPGLMVDDVFELVGAGDVAQGKDSLHTGAVIPIHGQPVGIRCESGGDEQQLRGDSR